MFNVPVMRRGELVAFTVLSVLAAAAVTLFAIVWIPAVAASSHPLLWSAATLLVAGRLAVWVLRWARLPRMQRPLWRNPTRPYRVAVVSTFVPDLEPLPMLEQTLRAMIAIEGAHDTWLLDEGDCPDARALCRSLGVQHYTRRGVSQYTTPDGRFRHGTKHGNYNAWLIEVGYDAYDILVAFDPDHVPDRRYLRRVLGYFEEPSVAFVQPPQVYYNQEASFIARGAAEETYAYYSSHLMASYAMGHTVVVGSHGAHRVAALQELGGFPAHDAEDLYLTMLYRTAGWRGVYVPEVLAMGTTPADWHGYLKQQLRWSRSVLDLKLRVLPGLAGRMPLLERMLNLLHGAYYLRPLLLPFCYALLASMLVMNVAPPTAAVGALLGLLVATGAIERFRHRFFFDPAHEGGLHWRSTLLQFAKWPVFVMAVADALRRRPVPYELTRKTAQEKKRWVLAPMHLLVAAFVATAWVVGILRHQALPPVLTVTAVALVLLSVALAATEAWTFPPGFSLALYARRQSADRDRSRE